MSGFCKIRSNFDQRMNDQWCDSCCEHVQTPHNYTQYNCLNKQINSQYGSPPEGFYLTENNQYMPTK